MQKNERKRQKRYERYMLSDAWKRKRQKVLKRARWKCEKCGNRHFLEIHHLTYERFGCERLDDLQALCRDCHSFVHRKRKINETARRKHAWRPKRKRKDR